MKNNKVYLLLILAAVMTQAGCASKARAKPEMSAPSMSAPLMPVSARSGSSNTITRAQQLITTASVEIAVDSMSESIEKTMQLVSDTGGFASQTSIRQNSNASLKLKVPSQSLNSFLDSIASLGEEKRRNIMVRDVTEQMADNEATLANKKALRDRLRLLLKQANNVQDILSVERELTRLQSEIDSIEGSLSSLKDKVAFSEVDLQIYENAKPLPKKVRGPIGYLYDGTAWFFGKLWVIRDGAD